jgi:hypothetical protein
MLTAAAVHAERNFGWLGTGTRPMPTDDTQMLVETNLLAKYVSLRLPPFSTPLPLAGLSQRLFDASPLPDCPTVASR